MKSRIAIPLIVLSLFLVAACGGGGGGASAPPAATPYPAVSAESAVDHQVAVVGSSTMRQVSIRNIGTANLEIGQITLANGASAFSIISDKCSGNTVGPSSTCAVVTQLTPASQADYSNTLVIPSNDTAHNPLTVLLQGKGRAYGLNVNEVQSDGCTLNPKVLKVLVTVTDHTGTPINALTASDFRIFENGVQKPINNLTHPIVSLPVSVALVLDYSMSLTSADRVAMETAAKSFIALLNPGQDEASIVKFALTVGAKTPFTTNQAALTSAIDAAYPGNTGGTILYNALYATIDDTSARDNRHAIIVFSDGFDEESTIALNAVIARSIEKGIPVFTITYMNAAQPKPEIMQQLAQSTGGEAFVASSSADMQAIYVKISTILSQQYLLEYDTSTSGGASVTLQVEVEDNLNLGESRKVVAGCQ